MTMVSPSASAARCSILSACRVVRARKRRPLLRVGQRRVDVVGIDLGRRHVVRVAAIALAAEVLHELGMERQRGVTDRRVDDHSLADAARIAPGPRRRCGPRPAAPWMRGKVTVERFREDAAPSFVPWMPNSLDAGLDDPVVPSRPRSDVRVVHAAGAHPTLRRSGGWGGHHGRRACRCHRGRSAQSPAWSPARERRPMWRGRSLLYSPSWKSLASASVRGPSASERARG